MDSKACFEYKSQIMDLKINYKLWKAGNMNITEPNVSMALVITIAEN